MTKPEPMNAGPHLSDSAMFVRRVLIAVIGVPLLALLGGIIVGYTGKVIELGGPEAFDVAMIAAMFAAACALAYAMWRFWPRASGEPEAARIKSARRMMLVAVVFGLLSGIAAGMINDGSSIVLSNGPISDGVAALCIAAWLTAGPLVTWLWWRRVDEHEADAYREGALVAIHAYMFIAPAWWFASRAGWLPAQDPMIMLLLVCTVWMAVWAVRKYR